MRRKRSNRHAEKAIVFHNFLKVFQGLFRKYCRYYCFSRAVLGSQEATLLFALYFLTY